MLNHKIIGLSLVFAAGCQATAGVQAEPKSAGQANADASLKLSSERPATDAVAVPTDLDPGTKNLTTTPPAQQDAMLGARAGLRLSKAGAANCQCLSVLVDNPWNEGFAWEGAIPQTNPATQLVVGLTSEGLPCTTAPRDSLGASYRGYEVVGTDVIVQVETARLGRPIAQGAVIPKPPRGGHVLVHAVDNTSPYGQSLDGKSLSCSVWTAQ